MECKKCISTYKNDCALYTINKDTQECTIYKNDGDNFKDYKFLVDCGGKDYTPIQKNSDDEPIKLSPHDGVVFNKNNNKHDNTGVIGTSYVDPKIIEKSFIFRNINYAEELTTEIIDLFDQIKESIENFTENVSKIGTPEHTGASSYATKPNDPIYPYIIRQGYYEFSYTADVHTYFLLREFYKIDLLADYLNVDIDQIFIV